ncbi:uncharacterized protein LOC141858004 [Brevipalpus obovatus]|uniref:uncharacterized protein LOC141858004 n=1 Tax=Brevipalpus obovatus TaxID=246614 RepID=UPI003D9DE68A
MFVSILRRCTSSNPIRVSQTLKRCYTSQEESDKVDTEVISNQSQSDLNLRQPTPLMPGAYEMINERLENNDYQARLNRVMEVYYSLPDEKRPKELKFVHIDEMIKMRKVISIRSSLRRIKRKEDRRIQREEQKAEKADKISQRIENMLKEAELRETAIFDSDNRLRYKISGNSTICSYDVLGRWKKFSMSRIVHGYLDEYPRIVLDFDYEDHMTVKQLTTLGKEVKASVAKVMKMERNASLYFCNFKPDCNTAKFLRSDWRSDLAFVWNSHQSYLDIFPKENLVYLTAHTDNIIEFNKEDIYIIGAMVDIGTKEPLSAIKAEKEGLRMAKLPIELLEMRNFEKSLNISHCVGAVCDLIDNDGDIVKALDRHVPDFKKRGEEDIVRTNENLSRKYQERNEFIREKYNLTEEENRAIRAWSYFWKEEYHRPR